MPAADSQSKQVQPSLWEIQKRERRAAVLDAARRLIGEQGYANTTVDEIAASARISVPTVYNYFGTKFDLLAAIYVEDREIALAKIADIVDREWDDPVEFLLAILGADFHDEVIAVNHALWRHIVAAEAMLAEGRESAAFAAVQARYAAMTKTALQRMIDRGQLPKEADIHAGVALFVHISEGLYRMIIASTDKQFGDFRGMAARQLRLLVEGLRASAA